MNDATEASLERTSDKVSSEQIPEAVVHRYIAEVLNGGNPNALDELVANDALMQRVTGFLAAFPDLAVTTHLVIAEEDTVAVHTTARATHQGTFQGMPATGRQWSASATGLYRVRGNRIVDFWVNWDLLTIMEQIGGVQRARTASA